MTKLRVGVIFGGRSGEHEVSIMSAESIITALDKEKYQITPIKITKTGEWVWNNESMNPFVLQSNLSKQFDVIFPVLHGPYGEDGTVQGLLELANIPYVGAGVVGSAVSMDKGIMRNVLAQAELPLVEWETISRNYWENNPELVIDLIEESLGYPCFIKPANLGSSVGISKAKDRQTLIDSLNEAAKYDRRIVVEVALQSPREIECSVLGNDHPQASVLGEIIPGSEFYDYHDKYFDGKSQLIIPADLTSEQVKLIQEYAIKTFQVVDCAGMARVDFFITNSGQIYVNEINTIPGFTQISMYPKLWEASGLSYVSLLDKLIELALKRHQDRNR